MGVHLYRQDNDRVELHFYFPQSFHVTRSDKFSYLLLIGLRTLVLRKFSHNIKYVLLESV